MRKIILLGILSFLGISCSDKNQKYENSIILWEDDYLMVEIISSNNLDYAEKEINRISAFGQENSNENGFTEITAINGKPYSTKKLNISKSELSNLLESVGLTKIEKIFYNGESKPIESPKTLVYGKYNNGIFIESENDTVTDIWFSSYNFKRIPETKISDGLYAIGKKYDMFFVDWNREQIVDIKNLNKIKEHFATE